MLANRSIRLAGIDGTARALRGCMRFRLAVLAWFVVLAAVLGGCYRVKPYEREVHTQRTMQTKGDKMETKFDGHVSEYREGAVGGDGAGGGGCGCN